MYQKCAVKARPSDPGLGSLFYDGSIHDIQLEQHTGYVSSATCRSSSYLYETDACGFLVEARRSRRAYALIDWIPVRGVVLGCDSSIGGAGSPDACYISKVPFISSTLHIYKSGVSCPWWSMLVNTFHSLFGWLPDRKVVMCNSICFSFF